MITDTFHGAVVSMKNHCNVAVFIRESINKFKLESLLAETGMEDRRLKAITAENLETVLASAPDYAVVDEKLATMAQQGEGYLKQALEHVHEAV